MYKLLIIVLLLGIVLGKFFKYLLILIVYIIVLVFVFIYLLVLVSWFVKNMFGLDFNWKLLFKILVEFI